MAKSMSKDSQIILNMMRIQDSMNDILDSTDTDNELVQDKSKIDLLTFYITKLYALRKAVSGKTKKALTTFNLSEFDANIIMSAISYCYPTVSNLEFIPA